jgi:transcriptional regulator with XRE-family HTH domain
MPRVPLNSSEQNPKLAEIVDRLFRERRHPSGREYQLSEVAEAINEKYSHLLGGTRISPAHISKIRSGDIRDPGRRVLLVLSAFFDVPVGTFFPELSQPSLEESEDSDVVRLRVSKLSPEAKFFLEGFIQNLQQQRPEQDPSEDDKADDKSG